DHAGAEAIAERRGLQAQRVDQRGAAVPRLERTHGVTLAELFDGWNDAQVGHGVLSWLQTSILMSSNADPPVPVPDYRPIERFWPYADLAEQPSAEEIAALSPELSEVLFGTPALPFSITIEFAPFEESDYARALALAQASAEYREVGQDDRRRHRARFFPRDV